LFLFALNRIYVVTFANQVYIEATIGFAWWVEIETKSDCYERKVKWKKLF